MTSYLVILPVSSPALPASLSAALSALVAAPATTTTAATAAAGANETCTNKYRKRNNKLRHTKLYCAKRFDIHTANGCCTRKIKKLFF
nr:Caab087 [Calliteara abietis nucleopolyhedrovirus]